MPLVDLGVPPGFTVSPEKLDDAVAAKTISKYTVALPARSSCTWRNWKRVKPLC